MRLGQLARQLEIKPDEIIQFLGSKGIPIEQDNNARIDDSAAELVIQHFAPNNEGIVQQLVQQPDAKTEVVRIPETEPDASAEIPEVIKAPKIELPGLRVLGKIDLPEKKKPEPEAPPEETAVPSRLVRQKKFNPPPRKLKNPVTLARQKEEEEKKEKLRDQLEQDKKRRKAFYQKRIKPQAPTRQARMFDEETIEMPPLSPDRPKTVWGRFMRWLNT